MTENQPAWPWDALQTCYGRVPLFAALLMMLLLQAMNAGAALPESDQEALLNMFDIGVTTLGAYEAVALFLLYWTSEPILKAGFVRYAGPPIRRRLGVSADD